MLIDTYSHSLIYVHRFTQFCFNITDYYILVLSIYGSHHNGYEEYSSLDCKTMKLRDRT
jgi:hypothetical protein